MRIKRIFKRDNSKNESINDNMSHISWTDKVNSISTLFLTIATIILAFYTLRLVKEATNAGNSAKRSADAAVDAVRQQKLNDSLTQKSQNYSDSVERIDNRNKYKLDSINLQTQINNFKETIKEFEIENRPFLQSDGFYCTKAEANKTVEIFCNLRNLTNTPVKIIEGTRYVSGITSDKNVTVKDVVSFQRQKVKFINGYITKDLPFTLTTSLPPLGNFISDVSKPNFSWYYYSKIKYENLTNNKVFFILC